MGENNETTKATPLPGLEHLRLGHGYGAKGSTPLLRRARQSLPVGDVSGYWFARGYAGGTCENQAPNPGFLAALDYSAHACK